MSYVPEQLVNVCGHVSVVFFFSGVYFYPNKLIEFKFWLLNLFCKRVHNLKGNHPRIGTLYND